MEAPTLWVKGVNSLLGPLSSSTFAHVGKGSFCSRWGPSFCVSAGVFAEKEEASDAERVG